MTFSAQLTQGDVFIKIVDAIKELTQECNFDCSEDGIECQCMDNSHVSLVKLLLNKDGFEEFTCKENISLGLNLTNLSKILKCSGPKDSLEITAEDTENITFSFVNAGEDRCSTFKLKLFDIDSEHLGIPETEYSCSVKMPASEFARICRDLTVLGDSVKITASKQGVQFETKGDIGSGDLILKNSTDSGMDDGDKGVQVSISEGVSQCFALRYLTSFSKSSILSDRVTLSMSDGTPLMVEYQIGDLGYIKYFLAPKVEDDDE